MILNPKYIIEKYRINRIIVKYEAMLLHNCR